MERLFYILFFVVLGASVFAQSTVTKTPLQFNKRSLQYGVVTQTSGALVVPDEVVYAGSGQDPVTTFKSLLKCNDEQQVKAISTTDTPVGQYSTSYLNKWQEANKAGLLYRVRFITFFKEKTDSLCAFRYDLMEGADGDPIPAVLVFKYVGGNWLRYTRFKRYNFIFAHHYFKLEQFLKILSGDPDLVRRFPYVYASFKGRSAIDLDAFETVLKNIMRKPDSDPELFDFLMKKPNW